MERDKKKPSIKVDHTPLNEDQKSDVTPACPTSGDMLIEINGPKGPEPTRYGDWEQKGRCTDF